MTTLFSRIIAGDIPGRFLWADSDCVAFLTIEPLAPGHALVVPRTEIDHWVDAPSDLLQHLLSVAQILGRAQMQAFTPTRIGLLVQGFEVPHLHIHVWPANSPADFDLAAADRNPSPESLDESATLLREALVILGHGEHVPPNPADPKLA